MSLAVIIIYSIWGFIILIGIVMFLYFQISFKKWDNDMKHIKQMKYHEKHTDLLECEQICIECFKFHEEQYKFKTTAVPYKDKIYIMSIKKEFLDYTSFQPVRKFFISDQDCCLCGGRLIKKGRK